MTKLSITLTVLRSFAVIAILSGLFKIVSLIILTGARTANNQPSVDWTSFLVQLLSVEGIIFGIILWFVAGQVSKYLAKNESPESTPEYAFEIIVLYSFGYFLFIRSISFINTLLNSSLVFNQMKQMNSPSPVQDTVLRLGIIVNILFIGACITIISKRKSISKLLASKC